MARANKQTRHERRFGRSERLVDMVLSHKPHEWALGALPYNECRLNASSKAWAETLILCFQQKLAGIPVIRADQPAEYYYLHDRDVWDAREDIPNASPPFASFFIEFAVPRVWNCNGVMRTINSGAEVAGALFRADLAETYKHRFPFPDKKDEYVYREVPDAKWFVSAEFVVATNSRPTFLGADRFFPVNERGQILCDPFHQVFGLESYPDPDKSTVATASTEMWMFPALLAMSFMHCKNVDLVAVEPDVKVNRERWKAGLHPFVRYHTLDIEPMRRVLKTEGNIEADGIKKALHICRGHFATYTDERPLFGKVSGTFWVPAHVRGTSERGVVIKDYRVSGATA